MKKYSQHKMRCMYEYVTIVQFNIVIIIQYLTDDWNNFSREVKFRMDKNISHSITWFGGKYRLRACVTSGQYVFINYNFILFFGGGRVMHRCSPFTFTVRSCALFLLNRKYQSGYFTVRGNAVFSTTGIRERSWFNRSYRW